MAALGVAPTLPLLGCGQDGADDTRSAPGSARELISRPILRPWSADAVHIEAPLHEVPMAYVSMARREVFVDNTFRDRSNWILGAHISVSTGVWRIPLPGDPPAQPITPGDTLREFEEIDIVEWNPDMEPATGDFRIRRGVPAGVRIDLSCVELLGSGAWCTGGPWDVRQCAGSSDGGCREDFMDVGEGMRHDVRGCVDGGRSVRFLTWACPD